MGDNCVLDATTKEARKRLQCDIVGKIALKSNCCIVDTTLQEKLGVERMCAWCCHYGGDTMRHSWKKCSQPELLLLCNNCESDNTLRHCEQTSELSQPKAHSKTSFFLFFFSTRHKLNFIHIGAFVIYPRWSHRLNGMGDNFPQGELTAHNNKREAPFLVFISTLDINHEISRRRRKFLIRHASQSISYA